MYYKHAVHFAVQIGILITYNAIFNNIFGIFVIKNYEQPFHWHNLVRLYTVPSFDHIKTHEDSIYHMPIDLFQRYSFVLSCSKLLKHSSVRSGRSKWFAHLPLVDTTNIFWFAHIKLAPDVPVRSWLHLHMSLHWHILFLSITLVLDNNTGLIDPWLKHSCFWHVVWILSCYLLIWYFAHLSSYEIGGISYNSAALFIRSIKILIFISANNNWFTLYKCGLCCAWLPDVWS